MADAIVFTTLPGVATGTGPVLLTEPERAFYRSGKLLRLIAPWLSTIADGVVPDCANNMPFTLVSATSLSGGVKSATRVANGGPNDQPYFLGPALNFDARMLSGVGGFPSDQDWTLGIISQAGSNALASSVIGLVGNNGRAFSVVNDGTNIIFRTRAAGLTANNRITSPAAGTSFWYTRISYNNASQLITMRQNGLPAGSATYDLIYLTSRMSVMGEHDEAQNLASTTFRDGKLALGFVCLGDANTDANLSALIDNAVKSRFPSMLPA